MVKEEWPGVGFRTQSLKREYRRLVNIAPGRGFTLGRSCINCRLLLYSRALRYMERIEADYIVTGDVLGHHGLQADDLAWVTDHLGLASRILRPLCGDGSFVVPENLAEWAHPRRNWSTPCTAVDRLAEIAIELGLDPRDPMGSCFRCKLTMAGFGDRVANLFGETGFTLNALRLLDFPMYYKVAPDIKIIVAQDGQEKRDLQNYFLPQDLRVYPATPHGPMTLVRTDWDSKSTEEKRDIIVIAARITATHANANRSLAVPIYHRFESDDDTLLVNALPFESLEEIALVDRVEIAPPVHALSAGR